MSDLYQTLDGSKYGPPVNPILPDAGDSAMVVMRYKNIELGFVMSPDQMDSGLVPCIQKLRECVMTEYEKHGKDHDGPSA